MSIENNLPFRSECTCILCRDDPKIESPVGEVLANAKLINGDRVRAKQLMDQIMKTWDPPLLTGNERPADIAQTATMVAIAYIMGREFLPSNLTVNQQAAVDSGLELFNEVLESLADERQPTIDEWMEAYDAAVEAGQSRILREEAERRYDAKYGRNRQQNDDY